MKLVKCPECNADLNNTVDKCNNCGFPIKDIIDSSFKTKENSIRIISSDWIKYHSLISIALSLVTTFFYYLDTNRFDLEEVFFMMSIPAASYWFVVFIVYSVLKAYRDSIINRGLMRLHIITSVFGGFGLILLDYIIGSFFINKYRFYEEKIFGLWFIWIIFYWIITVINFAIKRYGNGIIANNEIRIFNYILSFLSIILIAYLSSIESLYGNFDKISFVTGSFYIFMQLIFFSYIWIKQGFKEDK
jgi:hypothetical protein